MSKIGHNSNINLIVDEEKLTFIKENCESNIRVMMNTLQAVHNGELDFKEDNLRKLVGYVENFRRLLKLTEEATRG